MEKGQQDLRESKAREASLQRRLDEAEVELEHTKAHVDDLQGKVEKKQQDLRESVEREAGLKVRLEEEALGLIDAW